jgi:PAS domain-containing protein
MNFQRDSIRLADFFSDEWDELYENMKVPSSPESVLDDDDKLLPCCGLSKVQNIDGDEHSLLTANERNESFDRLALGGQDDCVDDDLEFLMSILDHSSENESENETSGKVELPESPFQLPLPATEQAQQHSLMLPSSSSSSSSSSLSLSGTVTLSSDCELVSVKPVMSLAMKRRLRLLKEHYRRAMGTLATLKADDTRYTRGESFFDRWHHSALNKALPRELPPNDEHPELEERLRDANAVAVWSLDRSAVCLKATRPMRWLFDLDRKHVERGQVGCNDLMPHDSIDRCLAFKKQVERHRKLLGVIIRLRRPNGSLVDVALNVHPVYNAQGNVEAMRTEMCLLEDVKKS